MNTTLGLANEHPILQSANLQLSLSGVMLPSVLSRFCGAGAVVSSAGRAASQAICHQQKRFLNIHEYQVIV